MRFIKWDWGDLAWIRFGSLLRNLNGSMLMILIITDNWLVIKYINLKLNFLCINFICIIWMVQALF